MLTKINRKWRVLRRGFSRTEWTLRLLNLRCARKAAPARGVVLIQVDGLSYDRFERALQQNRLPFIRRLLRNEEHSLKPFYAGAPCGASPAQAELVFGFETGPLRRFLILLLHLSMLLRIIGFGLLELGYAAVEFAQAAVGRGIRPGFRSIPRRIFRCIVLRELTRLRIKMDVTRGGRIVCARLSGYAEQSLRRRPPAVIARQVLKGIDGVIADVYRTAMRSGCRRYRLIVYSGPPSQRADDHQKGLERPCEPESRGFVLLPHASRVSAAVLRPSGLRAEVERLLSGSGGRRSRRSRCCEDSRLKVMTYNIHSCINMIRQVDTEGIARVIRRLDPDVVALQEVDGHKARTFFADQARRLAERLEMHHQFFPVLNDGSERYGLAVLGRYPLQKVKFERFPAPKARRPLEPRGAMWLRLETPEMALNFVNTHLGLRRAERFLQIKTLYGPDWLGAIPEGEPLIVCGDLNAGTRSPVYRELSNHLQDVQQMIRQPGYPRGTFFSGFPLLRLDHIFVSRHFQTVRVRIPLTFEARTASDHLPVLAELRLDRGRI